MKDTIYHCLLKVIITLQEAGVEGLHEDLDGGVGGRPEGDEDALCAGRQQRPGEGGQAVGGHRAVLLVARVAARHHHQLGVVQPVIRENIPYRGGSRAKSYEL